MKINEVLEKPIQWMWKTENPKDVSKAVFAIDGLKYEVWLRRRQVKIQGGEYGVDSPMYEISFFAVDKQEDKMRLVDGPAEHAFKVMATVIDVCKAFDAKYRPTYFYVEVGGGSRLKLYKRLAQQLSSTVTLSPLDKDPGITEMLIKMRAPKTKCVQ